MTKELLKKLKEAGFPFKAHEDYDDFSAGTDRCFCCGEYDGEKRFTHCIPTLEELIGACGQTIILRVTKTMGSIAETELRDFQEYGQIPEEAVANLWLKLHNL